MWVSTRIPSPAGHATARTMPGLGRKSCAGSSAFMRHSIAQPSQSYFVLPEAQACALGNRDLLRDQINARDRFGDRVFDLNARIHFQEIEFAALRLDQEFHGTRAAIRQRPA